MVVTGWVGLQLAAILTRLRALQVGFNPGSLWPCSLITTLFIFFILSPFPFRTFRVALTKFLPEDPCLSDRICTIGLQGDSPLLIVPHFEIQVSTVC